jgi:hypothetical protein
MKKLILLIFACITLSNFSNAQMYLAGATLSTYTDINPDTLINYSCVSHYSTESYFFDVNGDSQNDFELKALCSVSPGYSSQYIAIIPLNNNSYTRFGQLDSAFNAYSSYWMKAKVAKPLYYNDTINSPVAKWDSTTLYLYYYYSTTGGSIMAAHWIDTNDEYIGIKYQTATDSIYGWIRVNCPNSSSCLIKDYSISSIITGIRDIQTDNWFIFPNPATTYLTVKGIQPSATAEVYDLSGKLILNQQLNTNQIDIISLAKGLYFLKLTTPEGSVVRKFVRE